MPSGAIETLPSLKSLLEDKGTATAMTMNSNDSRVLYGAGAETRIFVTGTSGSNQTFFSSGRKTKVSVYTQRKQEKEVFGHPVLRSKSLRWMPELRFGHPQLNLFSKSFWEQPGIFLESLLI